ncbi:restriction endonuclease subunit S [Terrihabitans sp. B22-R8]|uniref:restriction endonuclease subunit S n=1 Tax=Terrihabitans sp. B22-R8 TaxID=3425128 RepID=UPI00403D4794
MQTTTLRELLVDSRDGEWGKGEPAEGRVQMRVIRGTDFPSVRLGDFRGVPVRYLERRHANRKRLDLGDILIETAGGTADRPTGRTIFVTPNVLNALGPDVTCASFARFLRIDSKKADPGFIFWLLQNHYNKRDLLQFHLQHTGVARFQFTTFADTFPLDLPDRKEQQRIASILGVYDDLIEVNRRRMSVLEEMAQRLFDEWFVQLRFPGHEGHQLIETPEGPLPNGWHIRRIGDLTSFLSRGIAPKYDTHSTSLVINQKCIRDQRLSLAAARTQSKEVPVDKRVRRGDILINSTGVGTLGRVALVEEVPLGTTVDSHVTIIRARVPSAADFLGSALLRMEPLFERLGVGATGQTELNRSRIADQNLIEPSSELQIKFANHARPLRSLAFRLAQHNELLITSRDLLLPRLISGEASVVTAERKLEAVA